jgi:hypothetical protein
MHILLFKEHLRASHVIPVRTKSQDSGTSRSAFKVHDRYLFSVFSIVN